MSIETHKINALKKIFNSQSTPLKYAEVGALVLGAGGLFFGHLIVGTLIGAAAGAVWGTQRALKRGF